MSEIAHAGERRPEHIHNLRQALKKPLTNCSLFCLSVMSLDDSKFSSLPQDSDSQKTIDGLLSKERDLSHVEHATRRDEPPVVQYRLYRRRFTGMIALVCYYYHSKLGGLTRGRTQILLNIIAAMSWPWFGPISNNGASLINTPVNRLCLML